LHPRDIIGYTIDIRDGRHREDEMSASEIQSKMIEQVMLSSRGLFVWAAVYRQDGLTVDFKVGRCTVTVKYSKGLDLYDVKRGFTGVKGWISRPVGTFDAEQLVKYVSSQH
jgi:hypothetical protein